MPGGPAVATILVIFAIIEERLQVLLVHRDEPPEAELWALPGGLWDGGRTLEQAAQAKLFACDMAVEVTQAGQILFGGWGYAEEYPISRYVVDATVLPIFEGVKPILELKVIGRALLA